MNLIGLRLSMFYRLRNRTNKAIYDFMCRGILNTPPLPTIDDGTVILSGVGNRDLIMYLVAIKSFHRRFRRGRIVLLIPDDFPANQLQTLTEHVNPLLVIRDSKVRMGTCPRGGTWERLVSIIDLIKNYYVIQLDADTVTVGDVEEVRECADRNLSFTIGTWPHQSIETMREACARVKSIKHSHVQILAEQNFDRLPDFNESRYVRGQSSFAGFARGSFSHEKLERFSEAMTGILGGRKWNEWGSESLASNFVVANSENPVVLPFPKYAGYSPSEGVSQGRVFVHFEGTHRFKGGEYIRKSREEISLARPAFPQTAP